jgi:hypothetical protein
MWRSFSVPAGASSIPQINIASSALRVYKTTRASSGSREATGPATRYFRIWWAGAAVADKVVFVYQNYVGWNDSRDRMILNGMYKLSVWFKMIYNFV